MDMGKMANKLGNTICDAAKETKTLTCFYCQASRTFPVEEDPFWKGWVGWEWKLVELPFKPPQIAPRSEYQASKWSCPDCHEKAVEEHETSRPGGARTGGVFGERGERSDD